MKKTLTLIIWLFLIITLSSCGQTQEEKNQEKAIKWWLGILYEMWKQAQDWASDQEVMNNGLDKLANLAGTLTDWTDQELTLEEKQSLKKWADMLKDWAAGLKAEMTKQMKKAQEEENKRKLDRKDEYLKTYWTQEQPDWAKEKWIIVPEWLTFEYKTASSRPGQYAYTMDYKVFYTADSSTPMEEAERILKKLWIKVEHIKENPMMPDTVMWIGKSWDLNYQIQADDTWFTMSVNNPNWIKELEK